MTHTRAQEGPLSAGWYGDQNVTVVIKMFENSPSSTKSFLAPSTGHRILPGSKFATSYVRQTRLSVSRSVL